MAQSLTEGLASLLARPVAAADRRRAALHVLDWLGCALLGAESEAGRAVAAYGEKLGAGPCQAIRAGKRDAAGAAFVNGAYGNVLEMDDIHKTSILHPGPVVIPAALALAERENASAEALLDGVVRGYEAVIRVGRSVGRAHYRNWHNTSTCGPFGAAAAAGSLLALTEAQTVAALGNAGTQSAGPWQCRLEGSMSKQLHTARAAASGLAAAELAALGFTGPRLILEGPLGFYAAMCADPQPEAVLAAPDGPWLIHATSFKPWPACRHGHATIDAALKLHGQIASYDVEEIVVRSYADAIAVCDCAEPATVLQAKFSLQHTAAIVLLEGPPPLEAFEPAAFPRAAALRRKVRIEAAEPYASAYPARYGAGVTVRLRDGRKLAAEAPDALGDPENPVTPEQVEAKARMLMAAAGVDPDPLLAAAKALAGGGRIADLTRLLP
jgi:2-methylcitrate dehydratase PrpD